MITLSSVMTFWIRQGRQRLVQLFQRIDHEAEAQHAAHGALSLLQRGTAGVSEQTDVELAITHVAVVRAISARLASRLSRPHKQLHRLLRALGHEE